ncbi:MAG: PAS domain S-box protein [Planctomycetota bacterium]|jgi:PAS domain S-box-containing protein
MERNLRKTGIDIIGDAPWGTHLCQFYQTKEDLIDILVPYFKAGLQNGEYCMWVTSEPLSAEEAKEALQKQLKELDEYIAKGQIEILDYSQWYTRSGRFNAEEVLRGWAEKEKQALASGFDGLRLTGNTFWLEQKDWKDFSDYEAEINRVIGNYRMLAICTYLLDRCTPSEIIDVVGNHEFALIRREHKWEIIESAKHKETERQLRNSELKLRTLIENAPIGIYVNDLEGRFIYGNEQAERIIGRPKEEFIGRNFLELDILGPEDVEKAKILQGLNREGKHTGPDEFILNRKDGEQRTLEVSTVVIDFEGTKAVLGMVQDVTEHRQAEHDLRAEKDFTETALNTQTDTFFVFEASTGKAVRWNEAFKKVSGYSDDQIRSMKAPDSYYSEEDLEKAKTATDRILRGEAASVELSLITRDGRSIPTEYTASLIRDDKGNPKYIIAIGRDITERRRAAEALRESEEKYHAIFDQAADSIVLVDDETGKFVDFNDKAHENLGYSREEFARLKIADIDICESEEKVLQHARKVVAEGADTFETKMRTKGGEIRDVLVSARGISLRGKTFISSVWRDVTEQKTVQKQVESLAKFPSEDPNPVLRISKDGTILYANEPSAPVLQTWQRRVGDRLPETCVERVYQAVNSREVLTFEFECTNGRIFFVTLAPSADGSYANAYGIDITEHKAAERELQIRNQINNIFLTCPNEQMYAKVLELVLEALQSKYGTFGYFDQDGRFVVPAMTREIYWEKCNVPEKDIIFERGQFSGIWARAVQERKTLYSNAGPFNAPAGHIPIENTMVTPIVYKDEIISAIHIANKPGGYDEKDKALLEMMADYVAPVLYARLDRDRRERERKQAEAALWESENKYRTLLKNIPQKIFYKDLNSVYVLCNESFAEDLKVKPKEVKGRTDYDFFPKDLAEKYRADDKRILESGNAEEIEEEYLRDGKNIVVHTFKAPLKNEQGDTIGLFGIFWDITEQRKAQEALKRSEERYALAQQAANVGSWDWNIPSGELTWSEQIEPMFGFGNGEFAGTYEAFLECVHPDDRQYVVDSVNACMETEQDYSIEHRIVWPDGSNRWLSEKGDVIRDEAGNAIRMVGVVQDITERRTAEERLLLGSSILEIINQKGKGQDIICRILQLVKDFTRFDAAGIRLREGDDYPYFEVNGFSEDFVSKENYLCARDESGQTVSDSQGRPVLECMCGNVILGRADPAAPFFTQGGSFWTNSTTDLLASTLEKERLTRTRNHCNRAGYESVALIPLRSGPEIVGLLQLNDRQRGCFTAEMIRFFEGIGDSIGIALARIKAEEDIKNLAKFPSENPYPVLRITKDGRVLYTNSAGFQLLAEWGCGVDERVPKHWYQYISRILTSDQPEELETPCGDRIFALTITPVVDAGYVNVYGTDITERKQAEEDLRKYRQHLEELVRARTAELTATNEQLRREIEQRKLLEREILQVSEREKRLIGQELHDSIGQQLTGVAFMTKVLEQKLAARSLSEAVDVTEIAKLVNQTMDLTRGLAKGLHPVDLDADSLMSALRELAGSTKNLFGISCTFMCDQPVPVEDAQVAVNIYRIAQEAVTNAIRHSKARNIQLQLHLGDGQAYLTVASDGLDFPEDVKARGSGMGLQIMNHRAEMIDGSLDVRRGDQGGTVVTCVFPNIKPGQ